MSKKYRVAVLGGGSWATAIVKMLVENEQKVGWYMRSTYAIEHLKKNHHNPNYLSSVEFDLNKLDLSDNLKTIVDTYDYLIFAIPSAFLKDEIEKFVPDFKNKIIFSAIKGIVPETGDIVGEYFHKHFNVPIDNIGIITGPCHAEEVALERLSYLTVASKNNIHSNVIASKISCSYIKTKISEDVFGAEYSAVLKNIFSIASGVAHGLGYGDNFQAVIMSNAIREINRFLNAVYPADRNINDLAYLGDLLVTGYSVFSRNRMFGNMIGKGYTVKSAQMEMNMIAEGYYATNSITKLTSKYNIDMPITNAMYQILYKGKNPKKIMKKLTNKLT